MKNLRPFLISLLLLTMLAANGQQLKDNFRNSLYTYVYKLDSSSAKEIYSVRVLQDSAKYFANFVADFRYNVNFDYNSLKPGHYLFIQGEENNMKYWIYEQPVFTLRSLGINNQIFVYAYTQKGEVVKDVALKLNGSGSAILYHDDCGCYPIPLDDKKSLKLPVEFMFYRGDDFTFGSFSCNSSDVYPKKIKHLRNNSDESRIYGYSILPGYLIMNQPKFKLLDTLKWKAFLLKPNGKPYRKKIKAIVLNNSGGVQIKQDIIRPTSKGAYNSEFLIADTLQIDNQYSLQLFNRKNRLLKSETFQVENYDLKKSYFNATINNTHFYAGQDIRFTVSAFDANELPLLDAKVNIIVTMTQLDDWFEDSLFVPFSWSQKFWEYSAITDPSGITVINFPRNLFPKANMQFNAQVTITTPEGENKVFNLFFRYDPTAERYLITLENDSIKAVYLNNSVITEKKATLKIFNNILLLEKEVMLPFNIKVEDFPNTYQVFEGNKLQASYSLEESHANTISFEGYRTFDSIKFVMINPLGINVNYKIYYGDDFIEGGSATKFGYSKYKPSNLSYHVIYSYRWLGIEYVREASFHTAEKSLNIKIDQPDIIYPGQKVAVNVHVTDYKNKNARKVNLAAYAINSQLGTIKEPEIPGFGSQKGGILRTFNTFNSRTNIQNYKAVSPFYSQMPFLKESPYYQLVFNTSGLGKVYEEIDNEKSEFSPFVFKDRQNQQVYAVYLNKKLVYVAGTNLRNPYSFQAEPGNYQVQIRTLNRMITINNVELKKGKKLFLCLQDDSLTKIPDVSYVTIPAPFLKEEQAGIAKHLLYFNNNFVKKTGHFFLVQGNRVYSGTTYSNTTPLVETVNYYQAGPFERGAIQLVFPGYDSTEFFFEPGTGYSFYDDSITTRTLHAMLEKLPLNTQNQSPSSAMILNDRRYEWPYRIGKHELVPPPLVETKPVRMHPALHDYGSSWNENPWSNFFLKNLTSRQIKRIWLFNREDEKNSRICFNPYFNIQNLKSGHYDIIIITENDSICFYRDYPVIADGSNYKLIKSTDFYPADSLLIANAEDRIVALNRPAPRGFDNPPVAIKDIKRTVKAESKTTRLTGYMYDQNNNPIDMVTIFMEHAGEFVSGAITNQIGYFEMDAAKNVNVQLKIFVNGKFYTISQLFLATGKITEVHLFLPNSAGQAYGWAINEDVFTNQNLNLNSNNYTASLSAVNVQEVGAMGVGSWTGNVSGVFKTLGKINLVKTIQSGQSSSETPNNNDPNNTGNLKDKNKFNEFFDKIKSDTNANRIRSKFRDYAYFIPNLMTDKKGEAHFTVVFPDNQTLWKTLVPAIDYHKRTGLGLADIKTYKPVNATLAMPKFLVEGDSIKIIGKTYNYTEKDIQLTSSFSINKKPRYTLSRGLKTFLTDSMNLSFDSIGKYQVTYSFRTADNYIDGEERTIPVLVNGTELVKGHNFLAEGDTTLLIRADSGVSRTTITVTNNQLDLLISQINKLKDYNYGCNEQNASKLKALLAEKTVLPAIGRDFKDDKLIVRLIKNLEKSQCNDGSWGWWTNKDKPEYWMTCYIVEALEMAVNEGFHTRAHIRGAEYLRANLLRFGTTERLYAIEILSRFYDKLDYRKQVEDFDTRKLSLQDKFRFMRLKQIMELPVDYEPLLSAKNQSKSGIYWGEEVLDFKTNIIPTSVLAYEVLKHDSVSHKEMLREIRKYFLNHTEMARNTIEQAVMLNHIVADIVAENQTKQEINPELFIDGQPYIIKSFPHTIKLPDGKTIKIEKKGAPLYFSEFQYAIEKNPKVVDSLYQINAWLEQNGKTTNHLKKSATVNYQVALKASRSTEYVMIEIPIPSSCFYADKAAGKMPYEVNREYFDDKVVIFCKDLPKGEHRMMIALQPRFEGKSTLLPVKVSLMYYPDRYGVNTKKETNLN